MIEEVKGFDPPSGIVLIFGRKENVIFSFIEPIDWTVNSTSGCLEKCSPILGCEWFLPSFETEQTLFDIKAFKGAQENIMDRK